VKEIIKKEEVNIGSLEIQEEKNMLIKGIIILQEA
jgi:hypothetical protein